MAKVRRKYWREQPWMCWTCGYMMDTASPAASKTSAAPEEGDASMCLNCGAAYVRNAAGRWRTMTDAEFTALPPEMRRKFSLAKIYAARPQGRDLSKQGGHA